MSIDLILALFAAALAVLSVVNSEHKHDALAVAVILLAAIHVLPI